MNTNRSKKCLHEPLPEIYLILDVLLLKIAVIVTMNLEGYEMLEIQQKSTDDDSIGSFSWKSIGL